MFAAFAATVTVRFPFVRVLCVCVIYRRALLSWLCPSLTVRVISLVLHTMEGDLGMPQMQKWCWWLNRAYLLVHIRQFIFPSLCFVLSMVTLHNPFPLDALLVSEVRGQAKHETWRARRAKHEENQRSFLTTNKESVAFLSGNIIAFTLDPVQPVLSTKLPYCLCFFVIIISTPLPQFPAHCAIAFACIPQCLTWFPGNCVVYGFKEWDVVACVLTDVFTSKPFKVIFHLQWTWTGNFLWGEVQFVLWYLGMWYGYTSFKSDPVQSN